MFIGKNKKLDFVFLAILTLILPPELGIVVFLEGSKTGRLECFERFGRTKRKRRELLFREEANGDDEENNWRKTNRNRLVIYEGGRNYYFTKLILARAWAGIGSQQGYSALTQTETLVGKPFTKLGQDRVETIGGRVDIAIIGSTQSGYVMDKLGQEDMEDDFDECSMIAKEIDGRLCGKFDF